MTLSDMRSIRMESLSKAKLLGYATNLALPVLDADTKLKKSLGEVSKRMLCLFCVVAVANNSNPSTALEWAKKENLLEFFTIDELSYLRGNNVSDKNLYLAQEEALWALTWATRLHSTLDFDSYCDESLVRLFPRVKEKEPSHDFIARCTLRLEGDILRALDLSYCLHWAVVQERIDAQVTKHSIAEYVIVERRRALEWICSDACWEHVDLST